MGVSLYHELAEWLADKLKPLRECLTRNCVRDPFDFVDRIRSLQRQEQTYVIP